MNERKTKRLHFYNLDSIRFLAALLVVLAHGFEAWKDFYFKFRYTESDFNSITSTKLFETAQTFFLNLGYGVEIFFFMSGFLITYILLVEKRETNSVNILKFIMRRSLRIWPIYFLLLFVSQPIVDWVDIGNVDYLPNLLFYSNFFIIETVYFHYPLAHYWSIALEEQFYLFWPILLKYLRLKLAYTLGILIIISILSRVYFFYQYPFKHDLYFYIHLLCRMDTLLIGAWFAKLYFNQKLKFPLSKWLFILSIGVLFLSFFFTHVKVHYSLLSAIFKKYIYLIPVIYIILYVVSRNTKNSNFIIRTMNYLGKTSYGIYMYHNFLVIIVIKKILINNEIYSWSVFTVVYLLSTILIAMISFELIEKPILKFKDRFSIIPTRKF
ncbi:MAG: acyltransferase family protein [Lishizhenia sp.]